MDEGPDVVEPQDHASAFAEPLRRILSHYGCILSLAGDGRAIAKGTGVLVDVEGEKLLVTARHVVVAESMRRNATYLMLPRLDQRGLPFPGGSVPKLFPLDLGTPIWSSELLDVAFLKVDDGISQSPLAKFFDATGHASVTGVIRRKWRTYDSPTSSGAYFIAGFPNFAHLVDEKAKLETLSALPLPAYITGLDEHPWDGRGAPVPQLILDVDAHRPAPPPANLAEHHRLISDRLFNPAEGTEPFGGFSGGAVIAVAKEAEYLIGIIHDGGSMYGQFRVFASSWDDCLAGLARRNLSTRMRQLAAEITDAPPLSVTSGEAC